VTPQSREELAAILAEARRNSRQVTELPERLMPETHDEGYRVNALVAEALGWETLGWKIAGTNPVMQQRLRTPSPIYGRSYRQFLTNGPATFDHASLLDPLIECEIFFCLSSDLPPRAKPYSRDEVADAVGACHAGIEIAECRFPMAALPPMPAILADGAASGRYVLGPEICGWRSDHLAAMAITLAVDGRPRRTGTPSEVMEHPLNALHWLANVRADVAAGCTDGLKAGEIVSAGTCTGMLLARRGDRMIATFEGAGDIALSFE